MPKRGAGWRKETRPCQPSPWRRGETPVSPQSEEPQTPAIAPIRAREASQNVPAAATLSLGFGFTPGSRTLGPGQFTYPKSGKGACDACQRRRVGRPEGLCCGSLAGSAAALSAKSFDFHESEHVTQKHPARRERRMNSRH